MWKTCVMAHRRLVCHGSTLREDHGHLARLCTPAQGPQPQAEAPIPPHALTFPSLLPPQTQHSPASPSILSRLCISLRPMSVFLFLISELI